LAPWVGIPVAAVVPSGFFANGLSPPVDDGLCASPWLARQLARRVVNAPGTRFVGGRERVASLAAATAMLNFHAAGVNEAVLRADVVAGLATGEEAAWKAAVELQESLGEARVPRVPAKSRRTKTPSARKQRWAMYNVPKGSIERMVSEVLAHEGDLVSCADAPAVYEYLTMRAPKGRFNGLRSGLAPSRLGCYIVGAPGFEAVRELATMDGHASGAKSAVALMAQRAGVAVDDVSVEGVLDALDKIITPETTARYFNVKLAAEVSRLAQAAEQHGVEQARSWSTQLARLAPAFQKKATSVSARARREPRLCDGVHRGVQAHLDQRLPKQFNLQHEHAAAPVRNYLLGVEEDRGEAGRYVVFSEVDLLEGVDGALDAPDRACLAWSPPPAAAVCVAPPSVTPVTPMPHTG